MAQHNTHRAPGAARITLPLAGAGKTLCGVALAGAAAFGTMVGAEAAPAAAPAEAPASVTPQAVATATQPATIKSSAKTLNFTTKLHYGSVGGYVSSLQTALNNEGANLAVDGIFGWRTKKAVINYQAANGLQVDGIVGPETRGALNGAASSGSGAVATSTENTSGNALLSAARSQIGTPYSWGASIPGVGFDCSGFTRWVYSQVGINLPRSSSAQISQATRISQSEARPGDLVAWPGHVGIYAGNGKVIDAGSSPNSVTERSIWGSPSFYTVR